MTHERDVSTFRRKQCNARDSDEVRYMRREQQVRDMEAKVAESVAALDKVKQELEAVSAELAQVKADEEGMKRKVFLAERAVIKMRLSKFLEHRGMQAKLDADKAGEIKALKDEINDLSTKLGIKADSGISEMVPNVEVREKEGACVMSVP
jgi:hypothetical protein